MPLDVLALVLLGALLHATWNALVKAGSEKSLDAAMVALGASVVALVALPFVPLPPLAIWPFVLASLGIHFTYYQLVAAAYRAGDIGLVYPLMRGVAPLIVTASSGLILKEQVSTGAMVGILTICCGILTMAAEARHGGKRAILLALANALVIALYTFVDGIGARVAGNPVAYTLWISLFPPIPLFAWAIARRGLRPVLSHIRYNWWRGLIGGAGSIGAYGLALWAMTKAPVATVAALRETAILFAIVISIVFLKEKVSIWRIAAACLIATGALLLKLL